MSGKYESHSSIDDGTVLGKETNFKGNLKFDESLKIMGCFEGFIESPGLLEVSEGAVVKANIACRAVVVGGTVIGDIQGSDLVEMREGSRVEGNIKTRRLKIADGVAFEGRCDMLQGADQINIQDSRENIQKSLHG